jgi:4-hydroxysphinganine ceramide fatty acyl 2-hydroxylase
MRRILDENMSREFLDPSRPLFPQIWYGQFDKEFYLNQVHSPPRIKDDISPPLFGNILEPLSKTPWWMVPTIWLPAVAYGMHLAGEGLKSPLQLTIYWVLGVFLWTFAEYTLHRFLFHLDR